MRNFYKLALSVTAVVGLLSCSTNIPMTTALDNDIVYTLEVNDSIPVTFSIENQVPESSFFQYKKAVRATLTPVEEEMVFNEYVVMDQMMKDFLRYRFTGDSGSDPAQINMALKSVAIYSEATENDKATSMNSIFIISGTRLYTAEVQVEVTITHDGQTTRRTIYGKGNVLRESFRKTKGDVGAFSHVLNQANNRVVYFTNQFLKDLGL